MFKCNNCGHIFEAGEEKRWSESRGEYWGTECYEEMSGCPICEEDYDEIQPCTICGGYSDGEEYCAECRHRCVDLFQNLLENNFTEKERDMLNEIYDGEWF